LPIETSSVPRQFFSLACSPVGPLENHSQVDLEENPADTEVEDLWDLMESLPKRARLMELYECHWGGPNSEGGRAVLVVEIVRSSGVRKKLVPR
jgi:hypothetical protein